MNCCYVGILQNIGVLHRVMYLYPTSRIVWHCDNIDAYGAIIVDDRLMNNMIVNENVQDAAQLPHTCI